MQRAQERLGGIEALATYLRVSPTSAAAWLSGIVPLPSFIFLRLVDLLLDEADGLEHWNKVILRQLSSKLPGAD